MSKRLITIAHSPDSDDAFMFYALKHGKVKSNKYDFVIERRDIEELNHLAQKEIYDITAISFHAYACVANKYTLTASGASFAEKDYGPVVVARDASKITQKTIAIPGELTTAFLVLKLIWPDVKHVVVPFEQIIPHVLAGKADLGLIIHEGQLQYEKMGLKKILFLTGEWEKIAGNLPLPLGGSAIKKSLGRDVVRELAKLQQESIAYGLNNLDEAVAHAHQFKRDLNEAELKKYLSWYANHRTLDMADAGKMALEKLYALAYEKGLLQQKITLEIV